MQIIPRKTFNHDRLGTLPKGQSIEVPDSDAAVLIQLGHATAADQSYETKVVNPAPLPDARPVRRAKGRA